MRPSFCFLFLISFLSFSLITLAQDGSDIRYLKIENIDTSYIGKTVHLDFYNPSFASHKIDTIAVLVNDKRVVFVEHREDDGFNNWFSRQYLEAIENAGQEKLRVTRSVIKEVAKDSILVTNYFDMFDGKGLVQGKSFIQDTWFSKKIITQILVHSEQCCK